MKKLILALTLTFISGVALANLHCGVPPIPEPLCDVVCICDDRGNCYWVNVCN